MAIDLLGNGEGVMNPYDMRMKCLELALTALGGNGDPTGRMTLDMAKKFEEFVANGKDKEYEPDIPGDDR